MEALPSEILRTIGDYLMPEPITIHMILLSERLDFEHIIERVLKTQNLQPFRSVVVAFKDVRESILPSLCQLSKFSGLAHLQVRFLVSHTMKAPGRRQFQQRIEEKLHFLTIKPDIKLTRRPESPQLSQIFRTGHWFNHKCQEYYSPTEVQ
ncbi:hypothetical protein CEP52_015744 [Fusarium oligoseptatum]|uniref:Uncharacterized protein n=1 Tax=Fusarium oligoseptatum TaxID=2604345 RepID=A0A428SA70_9HYPO|nr:hypothetical protein CEP52_015744 [Fusarium oligoseptatum]